MAEHDSEARSVATQAVDEVCSSVAGSPRINSSAVSTFNTSGFSS